MEGQPPPSSETPIQSESELPRRERHGITFGICGSEYASQVLERSIDALECVESCMRGAKDVLERIEAVVKRTEEMEKYTTKPWKTLADQPNPVRDMLEKSKRQIERGETLVYLQERHTQET
ncbi:hypothetical protein MMC26_002410 [Xylographa opegraphella]|nr:hypothetical protein [Xylographa opegraphella]